VDLLEQPVPVSVGDQLVAGRCPIPVCADEAVNTAADLPKVVGHYDFVNIKLDKSGGLTVVDLDGPLLQAKDWPDGIVYDNGVMAWPSPRLWG
jgi:L-alanine-DL-glutamate epimerase-like enolase superfamily enzyme